MSDWQKQFEAMRLQFFPRALKRLANTEKLLERLKDDPSNHKLLGEIYKDLHWLAGAGGTYKLVEISDIGSAGEEILDAYLAEKTAVGDVDLQRLRALVASACAVLASKS